MVKKIFCLGIPVMVFVFGVVVMGCASTSSATTTATPATTQTASASSETTAPATALELEGFWTRFDLSDDDVDDPEDWHILNGGSLVTIRTGSTNHSWKQEGNSIVITLNDGYVVYNLQIVNNNLLRGTARNINNLTWPVELRKIQNPVTMRSADGSVAVLGVNGYFILDPATRLYLNLSEDQEDEFMLRYMVKDDEFNVLSVDDNNAAYADLISYYEDDSALWNFDIADQKGSIYSVVFTRGGNSYHGIVANMSFLEEYRFYVVLLED